MKCIKMKITIFLLFLTNSMRVLSSVIHRDEPPSNVSQDGGNLVNAVDKECSFLRNLVQDKNISDYTINCRNVTVVNGKINEEIVLQYASCCVRRLWDYMCENKIKLDNEYLNLEVDNSPTICPLNLTQPARLGIIENNSNAIQVLANKELCSRACYDLDQPKKQCSVLSKITKYLEIYQEQNVPLGVNQQNTEKASLAKVEQPSGSLQKTESTVSNGETKQGSTDFASSEKIDLTGEVKADTEGGIDSLNMPQESQTKSKLEALKVESKSTAAAPTDIKSTEKPESTDPDKKFFSESDNERIAEDIVEDEVQPLPDQKEENLEEEIKMPSNNLEESKFSDRREIYSGEGFFQAEDSHFFVYFLMFSSVIIIGYLAFHNKNKILAYALEGSEGRRSRRRPNPARYRKLESNLEEAISSNTSNATSSGIVY